MFPVRVPPLRERRQDIPLLANHFRNRFAVENAVTAPDITPAALERMMAYSWPGNVRELENYIERAIIMHAGARTMPFEPPIENGHGTEHVLLGEASGELWSLERLEREYILEVLRRTGGHRGHTADVLGIDRRTLYRKLKLYD